MFYGFVVRVEGSARFLSFAVVSAEMMMGEGGSGARRRIFDD